jgi:hypothetical protein
MSACVHSVFALSSGFAMADPPLRAIFPLTQTMGLCVQIPYKVWMSPCVHSVFVLGKEFATG